MASMKSKLGKGKPLCGQTKEVVLNVYDHFKKWNETNNLEMTELQIVELTQIATGVFTRSIQSLTSIHRRSGKEEAILSPKKSRDRPKTVIVTDFDKSVIRDTVYNFHLTQKIVPTLVRLLLVLKDSIGFNGSKTTLGRILKDMGFRWKKIRDNLSILREKSDIVIKRINFLRSIKAYRDSGRNIVYTDETYVHTTHTSSLAWSDESDEGLRKPTSKGSRFIIVHAGNEKGFVPNALLMYKSHQKTGDYHDDMNYSNYEKWLKEMLIPNLEPNSVVVIDNASYHNKVINPAPTSASKKDIMKRWLIQRNIPFSPSALKAELYELTKMYKPRYKEYAIDKLFNEHGHEVLRLPPYHPDLNPIEKIWSIVKGYVGSRNVEMTLEAVRKLVEEKMAMVTQNEWSNTCRHVVETEKKYWEREIAYDNTFDDSSLLINLDDSDSSDSSSSETE